MSLELPIEDRRLYQNFLAVAGQRRLCLIGGYVRDFLLGIKTKDLDFVIESGLKEFLDAAVEMLRIDFKINSKASFSRLFTAKLNFEEPYAGYSQLDFSQARKEHYPSPASRPVVSEATLDKDILRRDFTINSIAIFEDQFIDLADGKKDLESKLIRIHHNDSFRDDPIRLVRAIRFAARLDFNLEKNTNERFKEAVRGNYLALVSSRRRYDELKKILGEPNRVESLTRLEENGLLRVLCPAITQVSSIPAEMDPDGAFLSLVQRELPVWEHYVDSLSLPKEESRRLKCIKN